MPLYPYFFLLITSLGWLAGLALGPIYALLTYVFIYFNIPSVQWWGGYVFDLRWSYTSAIILIISIFLHKEKGLNSPFQKGLGSKTLLVYTLLMLITVPFAALPELALTRVYDFFRYALIFTIIVAVIDNFNKLRSYLWVIIWQVTWLSWCARSYFHGERLDGVGPGDAGDANSLAVLLISVIPFLLVFLMRGKKLERLAALFCLPIVMNCFAMTRSRGGFVGLIVMLLVFFLLEKDKKVRKHLMVLSIAAMALMYILADQSFKDRLFAMKEQNLQSENAGAGRVAGWKYGIKMVPDYPLGTGGGGYLFLSPRYLPRELLEKNVGGRAAHNTFLLVLVEQGTFGLLLFLFFYFQMIRNCLHAKNSCLKYTVKTQDSKYYLMYMLGSATLAGLGGIFAASFFVDRLYYEGFYFFSAIAPVLYLVNRKKSITNSIE